MMTFTLDAQRIAYITFDRPDQSVNLMDQAFTDQFTQTVAEIKSTPDLTGIVLLSGKKTFIAGGDLSSISQINDSNSNAFFQQVEQLKRAMRTLETLGIPVVACLNGAALGGGWELALCCHYRIATDTKSRIFGLPEVTLGLIPGGGGVTRMTRLLGLEKALPYLTEGTKFSPSEGLAARLIDHIVATDKALLPAAIDTILSHPESQQPWDKKGYNLPGGLPNSPALQQLIAVAPALLRQKTRGNFPAPMAILSAAVEGASLDFDTASRIESRYLVAVARSQVAKNMIETFFFQMNALRQGKYRPVGTGAKITQVAVLGAGMMGSGIAWACVQQGLAVVLLDKTDALAEKGKAFTRDQLAKKVTKGSMNEAQAHAIEALITVTSDISDIKDCNLVIEAVIENRQVKLDLLVAAASQVSENCIIASNTSTLPITSLANHVPHSGRCVGLHFFSPVDRMQLVEIIAGNDSTPDTLATAFDFVVQLGKMPIVVKDGRGFYTSRVFQAFIFEGMRMLAEGIPAASIENAAWLAGMPMGPLAVLDNISLTLVKHILTQTRQDLAREGVTLPEEPAEKVLNTLLADGRTGKLSGHGFYDYDTDGDVHLWPRLEGLFGPSIVTPLQDIIDRLLFCQSLEAVKVFEAGVVSQEAEANIGAIFGIGFPAWTGGPLQFVNHYGAEHYAERCNVLAKHYGSRFLPTAAVLKRATTRQEHS